MELELERTPRGRKRHRTTEIIASVPSTSGKHELEDGTVITTQITKRNWWDKTGSTQIHAEGPTVEKRQLHGLLEGVEVNLNEYGIGKVKLTGTKQLTVRL